MPDFRLGIIGGCMSHQSGIPLFELYHHHLKKMLDEGDDIQLRLKLVRDFERSHAERVEGLLGRHEVDGVLLHIRPRFVLKAMVVTARIDPRDGKKRYSLHPFLWTRRHVDGIALLGDNDNEEEGSSEAAVADASTGTLADMRRGYFHLHNMNMAAGRLVGLWGWAIEDELYHLDQFIAVCRARGVPFLVLGPWPRGDSPLSVYLCRRLNRRVGARLNEEGMPFCSFEGTEKSAFGTMLQRDGLHLTVTGHRRVAEVLYPAAADWIRSSLGALAAESSPA